MKTHFRLSKATFETIVSRTRMKGTALQAARDVLVRGMIPTKAAEKHGISKQRVGYCVKNIRNRALEMGVCPCCGQTVNTNKDILDEAITS